MLFDKELPLLDLRQMFLEETKDNYFCNILMDSAEKDLSGILTS